MEMEEKNNMEQTAVEWFYDQIENEGKCIYEVFEQAKEMEKEQIINAFNEGNESDWSNEFGDGGEQYYNETFKSDEKI
jgi:hypothetical protein